jgi:hypothetical protein
LTSAVSLAPIPTVPADQSLSHHAALLVDRWRASIFGGILALYLLGFNGQWLIEPDGGLYLNLARNVALGRGYTYGGVRHETVYPGLPYFLAGIYRLVPGHFIFAADAFIFLAALASLALTYRLVLLAYDRPTAVVVMLGVAVSHEFYRYSFELLSDMPFLLGVMGVLAGHEGVFGQRPKSRGHWWDWAILIAGLAIATTTRPTMFGLIFAWILTLLWLVVVRRNRAAAIAIAICIATLALFLVFDPRRFGKSGAIGGYEGYALFQLSHLHSLCVSAAANLKDLLSLSLAKAAFGMNLGLPWLNALFGLLAIGAAIALIRKRLLWGLWVLLALSELIMFVSNERYLLPIVPLIVLGWWNLLRGINSFFPRRIGNALFALLLFMGLGPNLTQVIGTILQQRSRPFLATYQRGRYESFAQISPAVKANTQPNDIIICPTKTARMIAFLADRDCYEENEPVPWENRNVYLVVDPTDREYLVGLTTLGLSPTGPELAHIDHSGGPIYLVRAQRTTP